MIQVESHGKIWRELKNLSGQKLGLLVFIDIVNVFRLVYLYQYQKNIYVSLHWLMSFLYHLSLLLCTGIVRTLTFLDRGEATLRKKDVVFRSGGSFISNFNVSISTIVIEYMHDMLSRVTSVYHEKCFYLVIISA